MGRNEERVLGFLAFLSWTFQRLLRLGSCGNRCLFISHDISTWRQVDCRNGGLRSVGADVDFVADVKAIAVRDVCSFSDGRFAVDAAVGVDAKVDLEVKNESVRFLFFFIRSGDVDSVPLRWISRGSGSR